MYLSVLGQLTSPKQIRIGFFYHHKLAVRIRGGHSSEKHIASLALSTFLLCMSYGAKAAEPNTISIVINGTCTKLRTTAPMVNCSLSQALLCTEINDGDVAREYINKHYISEINFFTKHAQFECVECFVIIDDEEERGQLKKHLISTDFRTGITEEIVE